MLKQLAFGVFLLVPLVFTGDIVVEKCESIDAPIPTRYWVDGCDAAPCTIFNNTYQDIELSFLVGHDTYNMTTELTAHLGGLVISQPLPDNLLNACDALDDGYDCPIEAGKIVSGRTSLLALTPVNNLTVVLQFLIKNEREQPILCFRGETIIA